MSTRKLIINPITGKLDYVDEHDGTATVIVGGADRDVPEWNASAGEYQPIGNPALLTGEPTGFVETTTGNLKDIDITYDDTARTVTLTGTFVAYYNGLKVSALVTGWESAPHAAGITSNRYLLYDGSAFSWETSLDISKLLITFVLADSGGVKWAQRECHGLMQWQSHSLAHNTIGTYRESGGTLSGYVLSSTIPADRRPDTALAYLVDEDLRSELLSHLDSDGYTQMYLSSTSTVNFQTAQTEITRLAAATQPSYNLFTGGVWTETGMSVGYYGAWFQLAIPTTSDAFSSKYRFIWVQPQAQFSTLAGAQAIGPEDVSLGDFASLAPEFVFINRVIMRYIGGDWSIIQVDSLTGTRYNQSSQQGAFISSVVPDGITIDGTGTASDPLELTGLIKPQLDSTTAVRVTKADGTTAVVTVDTTNSLVGIGTTPSANKGIDINGTGIRIRQVNAANAAMLEFSDRYSTYGMGFCFNAYYDSGWKRRNTGYSLLYAFSSSGDFGIYMAGTDTAGTTISSWNEIASYKNAGNVGINQSSPDRKLEVLDGGGNAQFRLTYTNDTVYADFKVDSNGYLTLSPTGSKILAGASYTAPTLDYELAPKKYVDDRSVSTVTQASTDTLTAAEVTNTIVNNYGQAAENTQTLPTAAANMNVIFVIGTAGAGAFHVKAAANDKIYLDGIALDDGDKVSCSTPAVGNCITLVSFQTGASAYDWIATTGAGTWSDGGA